MHDGNRFYFHPENRFTKEDLYPTEFKVRGDAVKVRKILPSGCNVAFDKWPIKSILYDLKSPFLTGNLITKGLKVITTLSAEI